VVPRAKGTAARLKEETDGYKANVIARAEGDGQRFKSIQVEYQKAPQVTRDRLYLDAMQQIYSNVTKVVIDSKQGNNMLYLPLDKIMQMTNNPNADITVLPNTSAPAAAPAPTATVDARSRDASRSRDRDAR
jgi:modulator of FtsH protease HflK